MITRYTKRIYRDMARDLVRSFPLEMDTRPGSVLSYVAGFMARREAKLHLVIGAGAVLFLFHIIWEMVSR